jgi:hypothetical protein
VGLLAASAPSLEAATEVIWQMDAAKRAKSSGGKHEKAEYAWHDHWRYAFMRGSCFDAFVTDEGGAAVS